MCWSCALHMTNSRLNLKSNITDDSLISLRFSHLKHFLSPSCQTEIGLYSSSPFFPLSHLLLLGVPNHMLSLPNPHWIQIKNSHQQKEACKQRTKIIIKMDFNSRSLRVRLVHVFKNWKLLFENLCKNTSGWKNI